MNLESEHDDSSCCRTLKSASEELNYGYGSISYSPDTYVPIELKKITIFDIMNFLEFGPHHLVESLKTPVATPSPPRLRGEHDGSSCYGALKTPLDNPNYGYGSIS